MFSLTERATSTLLSRKVDENIDENVLKFFVKKNKYQSEFAFFKNDMVCSWTTKGKSDNFSSEVLYVLTEKDRNIDISQINSIFIKSIESFEIPRYYEYEQYMKAVLNNRDIIRNIIIALSGEPKKLLTEEEYISQINFILQKADRPFLKGIHFNSSNDFSLIHNKWDAENAYAEKDKLAFMGTYYFCDIEGSLKKLLSYKILEKVYGTNEVDSIYFPLRCEGKIYTAISSFVMEKGLFLTGVMGNYNEDLLQRAVELAKNATIPDDIFISAKRRLVDDIKFVAFQYGDIFALLPYIYAIKREISMREILHLIKQITLDDVRNLATSTMNIIAMGVR